MALLPLLLSPGELGQGTGLLSFQFRLWLLWWFPFWHKYQTLSFYLLQKQQNDIESITAWSLCYTWSEKTGILRGRWGNFEPLGDFLGVGKERRSHSGKKRYCISTAMSFSRSWKRHYYSWRKELSLFSPPFWFRLLWAKVFRVLMVCFKDGKGPYVSEHKPVPASTGLCLIRRLVWDRWYFYSFCFASPMAILMWLSRMGLINSF